MQLPGTVEKGDRLTAEEYARKHGLAVKVVARAIDLGLIRAELVQTGRRCIRLVDEAEGDEDIANLPRCPHDGCDRPVFPPSQACSGPHARGLETRGTTLSADTRRRMSEGKTGKPRPDVRDRVHAMHANSRLHAEWGLATMEGRARSAAIPVNTTLKKWKNRVNGHDGGRRRNDDRPDYEEALENIREKYQETHASERTLARLTGESRRMVRIALGRPWERS